MDLKAFRRDWSARQKQLRELFKADEEAHARDLFFKQHSVLHSQEVAGIEAWSYSDLIFTDLAPDQYRLIPKEGDHSLIWILWHISRIEDITMNILVAGDEQTYLIDGWKERLQSPVDHTGNAAPDGDISDISTVLDPDILLAYRNAVGRRTQRVFLETSVLSWKDKVKAERLDRLVAEGAVLPQAEGLLAYWGKRKIFELFLMPPTRHLMSHLNEANRIKEIVLK